MQSHTFSGVWSGLYDVCCVPDGMHTRFCLEGRGIQNSDAEAGKTVLYCHRGFKINVQEIQVCTSHFKNVFKASKLDVKECKIKHCLRMPVISVCESQRA